VNAKIRVREMGGMWDEAVENIWIEEEVGS